MPDDNPSDIRVTFPKPCDQPWEGMEEQGCHRRCEACDKTIFDLEKLTPDEVEALLDRKEEACVRARVTPDGSVATAKGTSSNTRAIKASLGAAATLALAACSTIGGSNVSPRFTIEGEVERWQRNDTLVLEGEGRRYKSRAKTDASFRFANLKPGTYTLTATGYCGDPKVLGEFTLSEDDVDIGKVNYREDCIIVGVFQRVEAHSNG